MNLNIAKEWFERHAALEADHEIGAGRSHPCNCIGPQKGAPRCPCMMQGVMVENGRYVQKIELGPAREKSLADRLKAAAPKTTFPRKNR